MIFKNAMSFKAMLKKSANEKGISTQQLQQNYLIEAFLSKLEKSEFCSNFIIKGGYLIGGIVGLDMRTTMDLDVTTKGFDLTSEMLSNIVKEIIQIPTNESFDFVFHDIEVIREIDDYPGFRTRLIANFEQIKELVVIDFSTGDAITPKEVEYRFKKTFSDETIELLTYPLENILAEKIEKILSRGIGTTRPRDLYDVYLLSLLKKEDIDYELLHQALKNTMNKRQSVFKTSEYKHITSNIRNSTFQQQLWKKYQTQYIYANDVSFEEVVNSVNAIMAQLIKLI